MFTYVELSCSWAQVFNLPSSCLWIPVSPVAGRWTLEHPGPQPYSSCKYRHPCTHTHTHISGSPSPHPDSVASLVVALDPSSFQQPALPMVLPSETPSRHQPISSAHHLIQQHLFLLSHTHLHIHTHSGCGHHGHPGSFDLWFHPIGCPSDTHTPVHTERPSVRKMVRNGV